MKAVMLFVKQSKSRNNVLLFLYWIHIKNMSKYTSMSGSVCMQFWVYAIFERVGARHSSPDIVELFEKLYYITGKALQISERMVCNRIGSLWVQCFVNKGCLGPFWAKPWLVSDLAKSISQIFKRCQIF